MDGSKTSYVSFWVSVYFQGRLLLVSGRVGVSNKKNVCMDEYTNTTKIELMEGSP